MYLQKLKIYIYKIILKKLSEKKKLQKIFFFLGNYKLPILCCSHVCFTRKEGTIELVYYKLYKLWFIHRLERELYILKCVHSTNLTFTKTIPPFMHQDKSHFYPEGNSTFHKKRRNQLKTSLLYTTKESLYVYTFSLFSVTFLLRRKNLLSGWWFCKYFLVHICYTSISLKNSYHGNSSIYI